MDRILKALAYVYLLPTKIANDKLAHFFASSIALCALLLFIAPVYAYGVIVISALFKEVYYDGFLGKGNRDLMDFIYSVLPIGVHLLA